VKAGDHDQQGTEHHEQGCDGGAEVGLERRRAGAGRTTQERLEHDDPGHEVRDRARHAEQEREPSDLMIDQPVERHQEPAGQRRVVVLERER
jgi:hypothetical protein